MVSENMFKKAKQRPEMKAENSLDIKPILCSAYLVSLNGSSTLNSEPKWLKF